MIQVKVKGNHQHQDSASSKNKNKCPGSQLNRHNFFNTCMCYLVMMSTGVKNIPYKSEYNTKRN